MEDKNIIDDYNEIHDLMYTNSVINNEVYNKLLDHESNKKRINNIKEQIELSKFQLQICIRNEHYEKAAQLRDEIINLDKEFSYSQSHHVLK